MIKNKSIIALLAIAIFSCKENRKSCNTSNFKSLDLTPVSTTLKVPAYKVTDTVRYGDLSNVFERDIQSLDSSLVIFAGVKSYEKDPNSMPDINHRMGSQKEQVETGQDSMLLITETFKTIDTIKVGYLKYLDKKKNRFESRIFFNRGKKFADIWLFENYADKIKDKKSIIDCVLENIELKK